MTFNYIWEFKDYPHLDRIIHELKHEMDKLSIPFVLETLRFDSSLYYCPYLPDLGES